jgi:hypothetical protein
VDYVLRFAKNSSSMRLFNPLFPGSSNCLILSWRTFTDVVRPGTFPFARVSPLSSSLHYSFVPARCRLRNRADSGFQHHTLRGKLHLPLAIQFNSIQSHRHLYFTGKTLVQANEQKCLSKLIVTSGFYVSKRVPLQLIERPL